MNQRILITGASGYVGAAIYKFLKEEGLEVYGTYNSTKLFEELLQCDLTNEEEVSVLCEKVKPDVIIHLAANANNGSCEENPEQALDLNVNSTKYLVEQAAKLNSKFIFVSSFAAYNPKGVYGQTKVQAEQIVGELEQYVILRPSLVIGVSPNTQNDRTFNRLVKDILAKKTEVEYDNSWEFNVTFLEHLALICKTLITKNIYPNTIVPVVSNKIVNRYQLAKEIMEPFGIKVNLEDKKRIASEQEIDLSLYKELGLPFYDYDIGMAKVISDIKKSI